MLTMAIPHVQIMVVHFLQYFIVFAR